MNIFVGIMGFVGGFLLLSAVVHLAEFIITTPIASGVVLGLVFLWAIFNVGKALKGKD